MHTWRRRWRIGLAACTTRRSGGCATLVFEPASAVAGRNCCNSCGASGVNDGSCTASNPIPCEMCPGLNGGTIRSGSRQYHKNTLVYLNITLELYQCDARKWPRLRCVSATKGLSGEWACVSEYSGTVSHRTLGVRSGAMGHDARQVWRSVCAGYHEWCARARRPSALAELDQLGGASPGARVPQLKLSLAAGGGRCVSVSGARVAENGVAADARRHYLLRDTTRHSPVIWLGDTTNPHQAHTPGGGVLPLGNLRDIRQHHIAGVSNWPAPRLADLTIGRR